MIRLRRLLPIGVALLFAGGPALRADLSGLSVSPSAAAPTPAGPAARPSDVVVHSVVQVFATQREPDLRKPWTKSAPQDVTGSGLVIEGHRILTNAHVVRYATRVEIMGTGASDHLGATVEAVDPGMDLAVLKLDDEGFFESHPPLGRAASRPAIKDVVEVYGFPVGGSSLSVTKGIVSRIEFVAYGLGTWGLRIQIDAAINHGNSGGPVVVGSEVVGLAYSTLGGAQNIGYIIPTEEIELFLRGVAAGHYRGKPAQYNSVQTLENPALRRFLKIPAKAHGVLIQAPDTQVPNNPLLKWDLITSVGGYLVDDEGKVQLPGDLRVPFEYAVQRAAKDGTVSVNVIRQGRIKALAMPAAPGREFLFPTLAGAYPSYFILGPMAFSEASAELVASLVSVPAAEALLASIQSPLVLRGLGPVRFPGERLVYLAAPFFSDEQTRGYPNLQYSVVTAVNGQQVRNLLGLVQSIRDSKEEFIRFDLAELSSPRLIFRRAALLASTERILAQNNIRSLGSGDVLNVWNASPP